MFRNVDVRCHKWNQKCHSINVFKFLNSQKSDQRFASALKHKQHKQVGSGENWTAQYLAVFVSLLAKKKKRVSRNGFINGSTGEENSILCVQYHISCRGDHLKQSHYSSFTGSSTTPRSHALWLQAGARNRQTQSKKRRYQEQVSASNSEQKARRRG